MLKLGGWSRLTWGRGPSDVRSGETGSERGPLRRLRAGPPRRGCEIAHLALWPARCAGGPSFGPPCPAARGARRRVLRPLRWVGSVFWRDAQAGVPSAGWPRAQLAFKDSMVRGILQFTPGIAFRYVLHRCESRDIRCRESCGFHSFTTRGAAGRGRPHPRLVAL